MDWFRHTIIPLQGKIICHASYMSVSCQLHIVTTMKILNCENTRKDAKAGAANFTEKTGHRKNNNFRAITFLNYFFNLQFCLTSWTKSFLNEADINVMKSKMHTMRLVVIPWWKKREFLCFFWDNSPPPGPPPPPSCHWFFPISIKLADIFVEPTDLTDFDLCISLFVRGFRFVF